MSTGAAPSSALERARIAYEQMQRREYNAVMKRRARARTRNIALAVTFGTTLVLVIGLSLYNGWMPTQARTAAQESRGTRTETAKTANVRSFVKGNTCQELKFSNESGALVGGSFVPCEAEPKREPLQVPVLTTTPKATRLNSVRDAFGK